MFDIDKFRLLVTKALGDRSTTEYSKQSGVNRTYISKFLNKKIESPPSPDILKRLSDVAHNGVTYEDFMEACGYIVIDIDMDKFKGRDIQYTNEQLKAMGLVENPNSKGITDRYTRITEVEEAMKIILEQPGLMLKGEILSDESKIILANAIQMGLRTAEELEKKKNKGDKNE